MLTVKEVARQLDLSEHTIRFYTDKGLVPMLQRDKHQIRLFSDEAVNCLVAIKCLRDTGMPLEAIRAYMELCQEGDSTVPQRREIILAQREIARRQLEDAQHRVEYLDKKVDVYNKIYEGILPDIMNPNHIEKADVC